MSLGPSAMWHTQTHFVTEHCTHENILRLSRSAGLSTNHNITLCALHRQTSSVAIKILFLQYSGYLGIWLILPHSVYNNLYKLLLKLRETQMYCISSNLLLASSTKGRILLQYFTFHLFHSCMNTCCSSKSYSLFEDVILLPRIITSVLRTW